eukprot:m.477325 g.477325  ORF g.477325 m.477325 type:complete len:85 (+) comp43403_c0_seq1:156-410(+)
MTLLGWVRWCVVCGNLALGCVTYDPDPSFRVFLLKSSETPFARPPPPTAAFPCVYPDTVLQSSSLPARVEFKLPAGRSCLVVVG